MQFTSFLITFSVVVAGIVLGVPSTNQDDLAPSNPTNADDFISSGSADDVNPSNNAPYKISALDKTTLNPSDLNGNTDRADSSGSDQTDNLNYPYSVADTNTPWPGNDYLGICPGKKMLACCPHLALNSPYSGSIGCVWFNPFIEECSEKFDLFLRCCSNIFKRRSDKRIKLWLNRITDPFRGRRANWPQVLPIPSRYLPPTDPSYHRWGDGFECDFTPDDEVEKARQRNREYQQDMDDRFRFFRDQGPDGPNTGSRSPPAKKDPAKKAVIPKQPTTHGLGDAVRDAAGAVLNILRTPIPIPAPAVPPIFAPGNQ